MMVSNKPQLFLSDRGAIDFEKRILLEFWQRKCFQNPRYNQCRNYGGHVPTPPPPQPRSVPLYFEKKMSPFEAAGYNIFKY